MLRIIAGKYKFRKLKQPDQNTTRSTTDKVREAVFSSLQFKIIDKDCLDLFSGSGAWAIEAMSRDANSVQAIELDKKAFRIILENIASVGEQNIRALNMDALSYLVKTDRKFDFIFIDAPFKRFDLVNEALEIIVSRNILNDDGEIIIETDQKKEIVLPEHLKVFKEKRHGRIDLLYVCKA